MEVYILDSLLRRETVVDVYESLIWTERFNAFGDFELHVRSTPAARRLFTAGTLFVTNNSYRVMKIETIEDSTDNDGKSMLMVKGRSIELILNNRIVRNSMASLTVEPNWVITDTPKAVMDTMFNHIVRDRALHQGDGIPFLRPGTIMPADTITYPLDPITWTQKPDTLYNGLKGVGDKYSLGFRLIRNFDTSELYFDVYSGSDRTTSQTVLPPVIFSPNLDNLQNTTSLKTIDKRKNAAYVFSNQGSLIYYAVDVDDTVEGLDRDVLLVEVDELAGNPTAEQIASYLTQKGREALSENTEYSAFDGEINQNSQHKYGTHYNLGDLVELRGTDGSANKMQVTEQIFVNDREGERSYPTLTLYQFVNTGSWLSWRSNQVWADLDADLDAVWGNQP